MGVQNPSFSIARDSLYVLWGNVLSFHAFALYQNISALLPAAVVTRVAHMNLGRLLPQDVQIFRNCHFPNVYRVSS